MSPYRNLFRGQFLWQSGEIIFHEVICFCALFFHYNFFRHKLPTVFQKCLESSSILFVHIVHHYKSVKAKSDGNSNKTLNHYSKFQTKQPMDSNAYLWVGNTFQTTTVSFCCDRLQSNFYQC